TAPGHDVDTVDALNHHREEWRFTGEADEKRAPVSWDTLKTMASEGTLRPDDLVWKPGMAAWAPASQVEGLWESVSSISRRKTSADGKRRFRNRARVCWAGAGALLLLALVASAGAWKWVSTESKNPLAVGKRLASLEKSGSAKAGAGGAECALEDA